MESNKNNKSKNSSKNQRKELLEYCGQIHEDDCVDPREYFKPDRQTDKANKKARQLCRQAVQTLDLVLADCDDEAMVSLFVIGVQPAPDSSRLLVTVGADVPPDQVDRASILSRLQYQTPRLRAELARSINRKRVPILVFNILAREQLAGSTSKEIPSSDRKEERHG